MVAASLLIGCASKTNVAVEPVALRPVAAKLLSVPDVPACDPRSNMVQPEELLAYGKCWRAAYDALFVKHKGLINAVRIRERSAAKAVKLAKS